MATYNAANYYADQQLPFATEPGDVKFGDALVAITAALVDDDLVNLFSVPAGHVPLGFDFWSTDLDSGGTALRFDLGYTDGTTTDRDAYGTAITLGSAVGAVSLPPTTAVVAFWTTVPPTVPYTVRLQVETAPTTGAAGTIYVRMRYGVIPTINDGIADPATL